MPRPVHDDNQNDPEDGHSAALAAKRGSTEALAALISYPSAISRWRRMETASPRDKKLGDLASTLRRSSGGTDEASRRRL